LSDHPEPPFRVVRDEFPERFTRGRLRQRGLCLHQFDHQPLHGCRVRVFLGLPRGIAGPEPVADDGPPPQEAAYTVPAPAEAASNFALRSSNTFSSE